MSVGVREPQTHTYRHIHTHTNTPTNNKHQHQNKKNKGAIIIIIIIITSVYRKDIYLFGIDLFICVYVSAAVMGVCVCEVSC